MRLLKLSFLLLFLSVFRPVFSQNNQTSIFVSSNGSWQSFPALLHLPDDYATTSKKYPLLIFLHGTGEAGNINGTQLANIYTNSQAGGPAYFMNQNAFPESFAHPVTGEPFKYIILSPQAPGWSTGGGQLIYIIADMVNRYRVDTNRIYLTGLSAGGQGIMDYASWSSITRYKPTALVPMSAAFAASQSSMNVVVADSARAWGFGSLADSHGQATKDNMDFMNNVRPGIARFSAYAGGHCCWNNFYNPNYKETINGKSMNIYEWMLLWTRETAALSANAGTDQTITLPTVSVNASGSGTPAAGHSISGYSWSKIAGPAAFTIANPSAASTAINGLQQGTYTFRLTVTDDAGQTATDDVQVIVNIPPVANAGTDQTIQLPARTGVLNGSTSSDADGTIATYAWTKISGPATFTIASASSASTTATNLVQGIYKFELAVTDNNGGIAKDTVQITVDPAANVPPVANAGTDQTLQLPANTGTLNGSGSTDSDGTIATYAWSKISGPATFTIASASSASTTATGLVVGVYKFELVVTDNSGAVAKDTVQITVNPAANVPPVANAGTDQTLQLPANTGTLNGSGSTDSDGTIATYAWSKISGPATFTIASASSASTTATGLVVGVYKFELVVTDNSGAVAKDTVQITVNPANNIPPVANAGTDQTLQLPANTGTLNGSGSTDSDGTIATYAWSKISGPATFTIASASSASTTATGLVVGVYKFELVVTDNSGATAKDTVQITVNPANNIPPVANAGADQTLQLPANTGTLNGSSSTDSDGTISTYAWSKISGPATFTITSASSASTTATGLVVGVYKFELIVTDNSGATAKDTVEITVNPANNIPPVANAGTDQTIQLPANTGTLNGSGSTDSDGTIATYAWSKISGPATFTITSASSASTTATGLVVGVYEFELVVTDNDGAVSKDTVQITVNPAANIPPTANAGNDQSIQLPVNTGILDGSSSADADGTIVSYAWSKVSGPSAYTITSATAASTIVNGLVQGTYKFELLITDNNGATSKDTIQIIVNPAANVPPAANAGSNQVIQLPLSTATLNGSGSADSDGTIASYEWTKVSGPATYTITSSSAATTTVTGLVQGVYIFELTVTDNDGATGTATVQVTVNAAPNQPPVAKAGNDQTIQLPTSTVTLDGVASTDPDGTITAYEWVKLSGPSAYSIASSTSSSTAVTGLVQGMYRFELTVTDNAGATGKDTVTVTVSPVNPCHGVRRYLTNIGSWGAFYDARTNFTVNPGDTLVINNVYGVATMALQEFHGTSTCPIVVINEGAGVTRFPPFLLRNCTYMKVTGSGSDAFYGFHCDQAFSAIDVDGRSSNIEIERIKITNVTYICRAKQDGSCYDSLNYPNWRMEHISIHDTWSQNIAQDGMYFGNTAPVTGRPVVCNGQTLNPNPIPMRLGNISIYNNYIDSVGRTGIQLGGADGGVNEIYNNTVRRTGYELNQTQGSGIIIGGMSHANVYDNKVSETFQFGIVGWGSGFSRIENNRIDSTSMIPVNGGKKNLVNTDNTTHYIAAGGPGVALTFKVTGTKVSGAVAGIGWVEGSADNVNFAPVTDVVTFTDLPVQSHTWSVPASGNRYFKVKISTTGSQSSNWNSYILNPGYDFSIACSALETNPANDSATIWIRNNIVDNNDAYNIITGTTADLWTRKGNIICGNKQQDGDDAVVYINGPGFYYSADCSGSNQSPVANAGPEQTIILPQNNTTLNGSNSYDPGGTITTYAWVQLSGPNTASIASNSTAITAITGLIQGTYTFRLTVTDDLGATATSNVTIKVVPPQAPNVAPIANAGLDKEITLPLNTVGVTGSGTDSDGSVVSYQWTYVSGPPTFTIVSPNQAQTQITDLIQGVYLFELKVTDNRGATATDTMMITVREAPPAPNEPPVANAGNDMAITLPVNSVTLTGSGTDPDGVITAYLWTKIAGPAAFSIVSPTQPQTVISNLVQGIYQFELTVTDNRGATDKDTVYVVVNAPVPANQPPVANAGNDRAITLPTNSVNLAGSGTDADGTITAYQWAKIAGPASFTIASPSQAQTSIANLVQGTYQFELTVTDNQGATGKDVVIVIVNAPGQAPNLPPVANAGNDITITLPLQTVTAAGTGTDADGTITAYQWTKVSGPAGYIIVSPNQAQTVIKDLEEGEYQFELKVTDNNGASSTDIMTVIVKPALQTRSAARLFPNPATTTLNIEIHAITHRNSTTLQVFDARGAIVYKEVFLRDQQVAIKTIDISKLPKGIYFIKIDVDINDIQTLKFIKQ